MKKAMILVISAVILIAGGYIGMKYVEKRTRGTFLEETRSTGRKVYSL